MNNDTNKNYKITRESKSPEAHGMEQEAGFYLDGANKALRPPMSKSLGSYAVHIYVNDLTKTVEIRCQTQLRITDDGTGITEYITSKSLDELRMTLMKVHGREPSGKRE